MNKFLASTRSLINSLVPKPQETKLSIDSYGQATCGLPPEQIQSVMYWLGQSLLYSGYHYGTAHILWYNDADPDHNLKQAARDSIRRDEPTFLYRCGDRVQPLPKGHYWRLMGEHPSMRVYQLEVQEDN